MTEFKKYLKEARREFCKEVNKYNVSDNLQLRTACDSFLIAFDQATEKAINYTHCCKSDSEQLPSFLYKSDGGLYFKHGENTDVTQQWNEYLKTR